MNVRSPTPGAGDAVPLVANLGAEQALLGAILLDNDAHAAVAGLIRREHFGEPIHGAIYDLCAQLIADGRRASPVTLNGAFPADLKIGDLTPPHYLARLCSEAVPVAGALGYARAVHAAAIRRDLQTLSGRIAESAKTFAAGVRDQIADAEVELLRLSEEAMRADPASAGPPQDFDQVIADIAEGVRTGQKYIGARSGLVDIDSQLGGFAPGDLIVIAGRPGMGKAQGLGAKVLTEAGWTTMGDIRLGDRLASVDGKPSLVSGVYPQGERQVYRVTFSDGRSTRACGEHLWAVESSRFKGQRVWTTDQIAVAIITERYQRRLFVPLFAGEFGSGDLAVDPWLLGALIGNGNLTNATPTISTADAGTLWRIQAAIGSEHMLRASGDYDYRIRGVGGINSLTAALRSFSLMGCRSEEKFIPAQYLVASRADRLDLMRGLMDTDGWVETFGAVRYSTSSARLAADMTELARSLGGICSVSEKPAPGYTHNGEHRQGHRHYVLNIRHPDPASMFSLKRKARLAVRSRPVRLTIISVEPDGVEPVQCIAVTHPSRLYVTDDYIVTHNTALALSMARSAAKHGGVGFDTLEMSEAQLRTRLLSDEAFDDRLWIEYERIRKRQIKDHEVEALWHAGERLKRLPLAIVDRGNRLADLPGHIRTARQLLAARGALLGLFIVDYLGLVAPGDRYRGQRTQEVTEISNTLKALARREAIPIVALHQLNRASEGRDDRRPRLSELRDSGALEQDADMVIFVHREAYYLERPGYGGPETEQERGEALAACKHTMEAIIAKNRHGAIGSVMLYVAMGLNAVRDRAR